MSRISLGRLSSSGSAYRRQSVGRKPAPDRHIPISGLGNRRRSDPRPERSIPARGDRDFRVLGLGRSVRVARAPPAGYGARVMWASLTRQRARLSGTKRLFGGARSYGTTHRVPRFARWACSVGGFADLQSDPVGAVAAFEVDGVVEFGDGHQHEDAVDDIVGSGGTSDDAGLAVSGSDIDGHR